MERMKIDLSKYKKVESNVKTKWQDEVSKWLVEFCIVKSMHVVVWKHIGKGGRNFGFMEVKVAGIRELAKKYNKTSKDYAGNFINIIKLLK